MKKPTTAELVDVIRLLCSALQKDCPDSAECEIIIAHVMYNTTLYGSTGRNCWKLFERSVITELEYRNLFLTHAVRTLCQTLGIREPGADTYGGLALCLAVEDVLFGRPVKIQDNESRDPWEL